MTGTPIECKLLSIPDIDRLYEYYAVDFGGYQNSDITYTVCRKDLRGLLEEDINFNIDPYIKQNGVLEADSGDKRVWYINLLGKPLCKFVSYDVIEVARTLNRLEETLHPLIKNIANACVGLELCDTFSKVVNPQTPAGIKAEYLAILESRRKHNIANEVLSQGKINEILGKYGEE